MALDSVENAHLRAYWDEERHCVVVDWKSSGRGEVMRSTVQPVLELMRRHDCTRLMANPSLLEALAGRPHGRRHLATEHPKHTNSEMADYLHSVGR